MGLKEERNPTVFLDSRTPQCFPIFHSPKPFPETPTSTDTSCLRVLLINAGNAVYAVLAKLCAGHRGPVSFKLHRFNVEG